MRQWFNSTKFTSYDDMKKKFTQEYSEYAKTPHEWLKSRTELKYRPDSDNIDEYIQKFKELATLLAYPEISTPHSRSPSPAHRSQINNSTANNRQGRPRQKPSILKRLTFQGFRQYPGNVRPSSLSNSRNTIPNTRFRSFSRSRSRPRFVPTLNRPLECYYCHCLGHTANNCFRRQNRNFPRRQHNQGRSNFTIRNFRPYTNYRCNESRDRNNNGTSQCRVNFSDPPMYFDLYLGNHQ